MNSFGNARAGAILLNPTTAVCAERRPSLVHRSLVHRSLVHRSLVHRRLVHQREVAVFHLHQDTGAFVDAIMIPRGHCINGLGPDQILDVFE
jgi:hypothetical protein